MYNLFVGGNFMINNVAFTINLFGVEKSIYWYGIIIASAMLIGIWVATYNARRRGFKSEMVLDLALVAVISAVIGARIHYVLFSWEFYKDGPFIEVFKIWNGGLAIYGGLIGGIIGTYIYSRFAKKDFLAIVDILAPSLILGQSIGRWGNFANQEAYGPLVTNPKWAFFPVSVFIESSREFHIATFFYESMWSLMVFVFLMVYMKRNRKQGNVFFFYLLLYGVGRVFIEGLRMDSQMLLDTGIRVNQLISAILIVFAIAMLIFRRTSKIAMVYPAPLFPRLSEKRTKQQEPDHFNINDVSDDLKLMDDDTRLKRVNESEEIVPEQSESDEAESTEVEDEKEQNGVETQE
jgi:phosphatidylglycerol:prolipoprotein diacylglycerol transferase